MIGIKLHDIIQKEGRGLPSTMLQEEIQNKVGQEKVCDMVLAAELAGGAACPSLLAVSVYDTEPVHFLTMAMQNIYWEGGKDRYTLKKIRR